MNAVNPGRRAALIGQGFMLIVLYLFLYFPIFYIMYLSFVNNTVWPFPPEYTLEHYLNLLGLDDFHQGLVNSLTIGIGTGLVSTFFATTAAMGLLKYRSRWRGILIVFYLSPLFVAHVLIGISSLMFNKAVLGLPSNLLSAIIANSTYATAFAFLVVLAQLARYDWRLDEAAMVFGASPRQTFWEITLPNIWPAIFGAFFVGFILAFNNLEISFYNLGAIPTLPTIAWGTLRHGIKPELYALASIVNGFVFVILIVLYFLLRTGLLKLDIRDR